MKSVNVKYNHYEPVEGYIVRDGTGDHVVFYPAPWGDKAVTFRYLKKNDGTRPWESNINDLEIEVISDDL